MFGTRVSLGSGFVGGIRESKARSKSACVGRKTAKTGKTRKTSTTLKPSMTVECMVKPMNTLAVIKPKYR